MQTRKLQQPFLSFFSLERNFSLKIRAIRPSAVFGTRRKATLRGEGFTWVPDLRSFLKLPEVGVSPYLCFIPILSVFRCFGWFEAVRGRLIGPKTWDRSVRIFGIRLGNLGTVTDCYGFFCDNLLNKLCFGVYKTGNG